MIVVSLSDVSLALGGRPIFSGLRREIQHGQRIGLIGPDGAGKSSLLKLLLGAYTPQPGGSVVRARGISLGYLAQDPELDPGQTALEIALAGEPRVTALEAELERVADRPGDPAVYGDPRALARAFWPPTVTGMGMPVLRFAGAWGCPCYGSQATARKGPQAGHPHALLGTDHHRRMHPLRAPARDSG